MAGLLRGVEREGAVNRVGVPVYPRKWLQTSTLIVCGFMCWYMTQRQRYRPTMVTFLRYRKRA